MRTIKTLFRVFVFINNIAYIAFYPEKNLFWWLVLEVTILYGSISTTLASLYVEEIR